MCRHFTIFFLGSLLLPLASMAMLNVRADLYTKQINPQVAQVVFVWDVEREWTGKQYVYGGTLSVKMPEKNATEKEARYISPQDGPFDGFLSITFFRETCVIPSAVLAAAFLRLLKEKNPRCLVRQKSIPGDNCCLESCGWRNEVFGLPGKVAFIYELVRREL